jgi:UDP-2,4-diacetamido-2,4,6-trideoxy-beta-L-altropyranose hydrolase
MRSLAAALTHRGAVVEVVGHGIPAVDDGAPCTVRALGPRARDEREDAMATVAVAGHGSPDVVIVDHYGLGAPWERIIAGRLTGSTVVAVDDLPGREHDVDVLIDPNLGPDGPVSVRGARTRLLRGPAYTPLGVEYRTPSERDPHDRRSDRVLVALGGGRSGVIEQLVTSLVAEPRLDMVQLDVVVPDEREHAAIERLLHGRSGARVHRRVPSLRPLLERADLVIGAGGTSAWQRLRLGVPTVLVTLVDNQVRTGRALQDLGLARWAQSIDVPDGVTAAVVDALDDEELPRRSHDHGPIVVDGRGADRIALALLPPTGPLSVRDVEDGDAPALLAMANDPVTRAGSREVRAIRPDEHLAWFSTTREQCDGTFFVAEVDGLVVGQVRFTPIADGWELHYGLDPIARGRGWSSELVREGLRRLPAGRAGKVVAVVGVRNEPSQRALSGLGFRPASADETAASGARVPDGFSAYLLALDANYSPQGA